MQREAHVMTTYRALHFCLPADDNLGDQLAHEALAECFNAHDVNLDIEQVNIRDLRNSDTRLDDQIDAFNNEYDLIVIGAGGLLLPFFLESIFTHPDSWSKISIPLVFFGVGAIGEFVRPIWYTNASPDGKNHLTAALNAAASISVRDLRSWLLVSRLLRNDQSRIFMTGCPTAFCVAAGQLDTPRPYKLALNIPFAHGGCIEYQKQLLIAAEVAVKNINGINWICHSQLEYEHAQKFKDSLDGSFDITLPSTSDEIAKAYSSCEFGLVTKAHAGIFCLANNTPFAFLSYDMKCDALMEMIVDFPHHYLIHIDELSEDIPKKIIEVMSRVETDKLKIKNSQKLLTIRLRDEFTSFMNHIKLILER